MIKWNSMLNQLTNLASELPQSNKCYVVKIYSQTIYFIETVPEWCTGCLILNLLYDEA